jgi:hypothetical protein
MRSDKNAECGRIKNNEIRNSKKDVGDWRIEVGNDE